MPRKSSMKKSSSRPTVNTAPSKRHNGPVVTDKYVHATKCGANYFHAVHSPFTLEEEACIPSVISRPSQKIKVVSRGDFRLSTAGCGGVGYWPYRMIWSDVYTSTATTAFPAIVTSTAISTADGEFPFLNTPVPNPATTSIALHGGQTSPYKSTNFIGSVDGDNDQLRNCRLVGAGIRVFYEDKEVDRSGNYIVWRNPSTSQELLATADTVSDVLATIDACKARVSDMGSAGVTYAPVMSSDLDYPNSARVNEGETGSMANRLAGAVLISNGQPGQRFSFEAVAFFEVIGKGVPLTPNSSDVDMIGVTSSAGAAAALHPSIDVQFASVVQNAYTIAKRNGIILNLANLAGSLVLRGIDNRTGGMGSSLMRAIRG